MHTEKTAIVPPDRIKYSSQSTSKKPKKGKKKRGKQKDSPAYHFTCDLNSIFSQLYHDNLIMARELGRQEVLSEMANNLNVVAAVDNPK